MKFSGRILARKARRLEGSERWREAAATYRAALNRSDGEGWWQFRLGYALEQTGDWPGAVEAYRAAAGRGDGQEARWQFRLGYALEQTGDWPGAVEAYRAAVGPDGRQEPQWYFRLGWALQNIGSWSAAAACYRTAIAFDDGHPRWHYRLGQVLERTNDWGPARRAYLDSSRLASAESRDLLEELPYAKRIDLGLIGRPAYAYCLYRGCRLARHLDIPRITAIEFGVAGGRGLLAMEERASEVTALTGVEVDVVGFDTGEGMYEPVDHRDMPYYFAPGNYSMDVAALRSRLGDAELVLGDAGDTFVDFLESGPAPIGTISFDMDFYSSTQAVLTSMGDEAIGARFLPRVSLYFDNVSGRRGQDYSEFAGELLAVNEFNDSNKWTKVAEDRRFRTLPLNFGWHHSIYMLHRFTHEDYNRFVGPDTADSLALRS